MKVSVKIFTGESHYFSSTVLVLNLMVSLLLVLLNGSAGTEAVRCFCDARNCEDALCHGSACLVGFKSDVRLVQSCVSEADGLSLMDCALDRDGWDEVCSCHRDFCNTFTYLRTMIQRNQRSSGSRRRKKTSYGHQTAAGSGGQDHENSIGDIMVYDYDGSDNHNNNKLSRRRQLSTANDYNNNNNRRNNADNEMSGLDFVPYRSNQLIILLVILPLAIGALTVTLIFLNYHCKMC